MMDVEYMLKDLKRGKRKIQRKLYEQYKGLFFAICLRYIKSYHDAEEVLSNSFVKIFTRIDQFKDKGSFEGWMKRIVVNEALMFIRSQHNFHIHVDVDHHNFVEDEEVLGQLYAEDLILLLNQLSDGYRTVFNLYVIEGYKHREIADMLGISIHTSKTQLMMAKKRLIELLKKNRQLYGWL